MEMDMRTESARQADAIAADLDDLNMGPMPRHTEMNAGGGNMRTETARQADSIAATDREMNPGVWSPNFCAAHPISPMSVSSSLPPVSVEERRRSVSACPACVRGGVLCPELAPFYIDEEHNRACKDGKWDTLLTLDVA